MKAAVLEKPNLILIKELPTVEPQKGEVRIKLLKVGICGSDVHVFLGHRILDKPTVIGHEGIGFIDKIGDEVLNRKIGERVVIEPNIPCKACRHCLQGNGHYCSNKKVLGINENGCFAEYICLPADFCWALPDSISNENAVCIEPMAVALSALFKASCKPGDAIAVVGLGAIGLLVTHLALALGFRVFVTEIVPQKIKLATDIGAKLVKGNAEKINQIWESNEVSAVFECAGSAETATLVTAAAPRGSEIVLVGLSGNPATFIPLKIAREGISILSSIIYDHSTDFKRVIQLIESKLINPGFIISSCSSLANLSSALQLATQGNETKIVIEI
jgi:L-iditol 2-dehydrogenase